MFISGSGSPQGNFEQLCRAVVERNYRRYGTLRATAAQPGIEFHLKLHTACSLGEPGRWWGWQCRFYEFSSVQSLGATRRKKIEEAISKTLEKVGTLTDWVLWTRLPLTKEDQKWFYGLDAGGMRLDLWTADDIETRLVGEASLLRATYFGELTLTNDDLDGLHATTIAPIRTRWTPQVHQPVAAERRLRRILLGGDAHAAVAAVADRARSVGNELAAETAGAPDAVVESAAAVRSLVDACKEHLELVEQAMERGGFLGATRDLPAAPHVTPEHELALRTLRKFRHPAALSATNAVAYVHDATRLLAAVDDMADIGIVAVLADAGCGKTQLSAQLTAANADRPAGVLLFGRNLAARDGLDDLAGTLTIHGKPCPGFEALLEVVDAAGQRAGRRLPVVIDSLNEAEDPRRWKDLLSPLAGTLKRFPHVVVVCTLRPAFESQCLPLKVERVDIPNFGTDTGDAIRRYFEYYRIDASDADLPLHLLRHPLTLKLFCDVTNPDREKTVGIERMPGSRATIYERYLDQAADRIAELSPANCQITADDVRRALHKFGLALWNRRSRGVPQQEVRDMIKDHAAWNCSIVRALQDEGVLAQAPGDAFTDPQVIPSYDLLGGYLVASARLAELGVDAVRTWIKEGPAYTDLTGPHPSGQPLGQDILAALTALLPKNGGGQLWSIVDSRLKDTALRAAAQLDAHLLDADTVSELKTLATTGVADLFEQLRQVRGAPDHPLNAQFLDAILRPMTVSERDLRWSEWLRHNSDEIRADLRDLERGWRGRREHTDRDRLRARWVMWTLTSTVRELRDQATSSLYWFGRTNPEDLFTLALDALAVNDPYVSERMLAASYGVTMANQLPNQQMDEVLPRYLAGLRDALVGDAATHPTSHWLARLYSQGTAQLAQRYYSHALPDGLLVGGRISFASGPGVELIDANDDRAAEVGQTLHMDFHNYTLGRLCRGRRNYDYSDPVHKRVTAYVRGSVWELGWRQQTLGVVDSQIVQASSGGRTSRPTERYGKKYGWIGYYSAAGQLDDEGELTPRSERLSDLSIDPSFPERPAQASVRVPDWATSEPADLADWVAGGTVRVPEELLYCAEIENYPGPWIAVNAF
ncbi:MAG: hypothetical protein ACJ786_19800, partial [Catenulispora sp.]